MENYPSNMWIVSENEFDQFVINGGKVVYIAEEPDLKYRSHPAIITAGALLPPFEAIQAELDDDIMTSNSIYSAYLNSQEASMYVSIVIAAAIKQIPIGIMFGKDELNMQFPKMLINFFFNNFGIVFGVANKVMPYIVKEAMPFNLALLYNMNIIDYRTFMEKHPPLPINPMCVSKLAIDINPWIQDKSFNGYLNYFEYIKECTLSNNRNLVIDPMVVAT